MDPWNAFNEQLAVTKQIVEELKKVNANLTEINGKLDENINKEKGFSLEELFSEILGPVVNSNDIDYGDCEDDLYDWGNDEEEENDLEFLEELAEEDIDDILAQRHLPIDVFGSNLYLYVPDVNYDDVVFDVNHLERKVTASLYFGDEIIKEAVSKCSPEDVFIKATGKAVALRYLFDLEVPETLLQK